MHQLLQAGSWLSARPLQSLSSPSSHVPAIVQLSKAPGFNSRVGIFAVRAPCTQRPEGRLRRRRRHPRLRRSCHQRLADLGGAGIHVRVGVFAVRLWMRAPRLRPCTVPVPVPVDGAGVRLGGSEPENAEEHRQRKENPFSHRGFSSCDVFSFKPDPIDDTFLFLILSSFSGGRGSPRRRGLILTSERAPFMDKP